VPTIPSTEAVEKNSMPALMCLIFFRLDGVGGPLSEGAAAFEALSSPSDEEEEEELGKAMKRPPWSYWVFQGWGEESVAHVHT
jgi:hypothetical protein